MTSKSRTSAKEPRSAAVIGSGFGGLAMAIRLQARGLPTTLYEKRDKLGGKAYVFEDKGFTFDAGPTVITAPQCLFELFELAGKRMEDYVQLMPVSPLYKLFWEGGQEFIYDNDSARLYEEIGKRSAEDVQGYQRYMRHAQKIFEQGYEQLADAAFLSFWDMIKVSPQLIRLRAYESIYKCISRYFRDPIHRQVFSFNSLLIGGNPFKASSIYTLIHPLERKWGVWFPKGGTHALVRALGQLFTDLGGKIVLDCPVAEITTAGNQVTGVKLPQGEHVAHDIVVSNADLMHTYANLLKNSPRGKKASRSLKRRDFSMSLFVIYFGTDRDYDNLSHHNVMFGNRYKELLTDIFNGPIVPDDFSLYLHAPCKSDASLAPQGCYSYYALAPVPNLKKAPTDWKKEAPAYADRILTYLQEHYMPGLKASIKTLRTYSPEDFQNDQNAYQGAAFSLTPNLTQSAYFRAHNRDDVLSGLYFVGAGTHPGAGVPGVVASAKATFSVLAKDYPVLAADAAATCHAEVAHAGG